MINHSETINRKDLCKLLTQTFIEDTISAIDYAEDGGWREEEDAEKLRTNIKKIGHLCGIIRYK